MKRICVALTCVVILVICSSYKAGLTQSPRFGRPIPAQDQERLDEPYKGLTTDGNIVPGLFGIKSTGVSTKPVRTAAENFLKGLSEEQRKMTMFPIDDQEWRKWDNRHFAARQGMGFVEMTGIQRELAFGLIKAGLSAKGLQKSRDIMKLNETLAELTNRFEEYGQWLYWITIMGTPSDTQPWGWQLDGHHLIINYFILGDQVVMTPTFMGSEPIRAESGKFKGTEVMQDEQNKGFNFYTSLNNEQRSKATIKTDKGTNHNLTEAYRDNLVLDYAGLPVSSLDTAQRLLFLDLVSEYVGNISDGHARVKMEEVKKHLDKTYFAWIGNADPEGVFYYRIQSPVILIEFDHQRPVALARTPEPTRKHIHTVVRTPNGNDYGKDLLRRHHEQHSHK